MSPKPRRSAGRAEGQDPALANYGEFGKAVAIIVAVTTLPIGSFLALFNSTTSRDEVTASPSPHPSPIESVEASPSPTVSATPTDGVLVEWTPTPTPPKASAAQPKPVPTRKDVPKPTTSPSQKPTPTKVTTGPVPAGLSGASAAVKKLAVAAEQLFPAAGPYGGYRPADGYGEHSTGKAIDIMVPNLTVGQAVADHFRANASKYNIKHIIWNQHIWSVARSSEGWRLMEDRGNPTQNHRDHVHILTN